MDVEQALDLGGGSAAGQKDPVGIGIIRVVAMHARRRPSAAVEIATADQPAGLQQEHQLTVASIRKEDAEPLELVVGENAPVGSRPKPILDPPARFVGREPEAT